MSYEASGKGIIDDQIGLYFFRYVRWLPTGQVVTIERKSHHNQRQSLHASKPLSIRTPPAYIFIFIRTDTLIHT